MNSDQREVIKTSARYLFQSNANDLSQPSAPIIRVKWAESFDEIAAAQRLRLRVFNLEYGAGLIGVDGRDVDMFDHFSKHLIAIDQNTGEVVGTYRVLLPENARQAGQLYMDTEFDLTRLAFTRYDIIELGRSCVDFAYRDGSVIRRLWTALADYLSNRCERYLIGCVSVPTKDGGQYANSLYQGLRSRLAENPMLRVVPIESMPAVELNDAGSAVSPALMRSYLKLGAKLMGAPFYDKQFQCADFPMMIEASKLEEKFARTQRRFAA